MKNSVRSAVYLLVPCLALMAMALYLTRRAAVAPPPSTPTTTGPFFVKIAGIETQKTLPVNVYNGYERRFHLVFEAEGTRPKGWGAPVNGWSSEAMTNYRFWLERAGKREKFAPLDTRIETTRWNQNKGRYYNEITLRTGPVPDNAALKLSGVGRIAPYGSPVYGPPIPFEVTLKKAGQPWAKPNVSTATGVTIQKIEIKKTAGGQTMASATLLLAPGVDADHQVQHSPQFLSPDWSVGDVRINASYGGGSPAAYSRRIIYNMEWASSQVSRSPRRDLILVERIDFAGKWPLEIAFAVKKDGQPVYGIVPALSRPPGK